jgi:hypothetical protein
MSPTQESHSLTVSGPVKLLLNSEVGLSIVLESYYSLSQNKGKSFSVPAMKQKWQWSFVHSYPLH